MLIPHEWFDIGQQVVIVKEMMLMRILVPAVMTILWQMGQCVVLPLRESSIIASQILIATVTCRFCPVLFFLHSRYSASSMLGYLCNSGEML